jgi:hypothetical protein
MKYIILCGGIGRRNNNYSLPRVNELSRFERYSKFKLVKILNFNNLNDFKLDILNTHRSGSDFWAFGDFDKLNYKYSLYSHRPIPKNNENDSRTTRIIKEKYPINFFSIKEGKFISAPAIAISFAKEINNND